MDVAHGTLERAGAGYRSRPHSKSHKIKAQGVSFHGISFPSLAAPGHGIAVGSADAVSAAAIEGSADSDSCRTSKVRGGNDMIDLTIEDDEPENPRQPAYGDGSQIPAFVHVIRTAEAAASLPDCAICCEDWVQGHE